MTIWLINEFSVQPDCESGLLLKYIDNIFLFSEILMITLLPNTLFV